MAAPCRRLPAVCLPFPPCAFWRRDHMLPVRHAPRKNPDNFFGISQTGCWRVLARPRPWPGGLIRCLSPSVIHIKPRFWPLTHPFSRALRAPATPGSFMMMSNSAGASSGQSPAIISRREDLLRGPGEICRRGPQAHQHCCKGDFGHRAGHFCCGCGRRARASFGRSTPCRMAGCAASFADCARATPGAASGAGRSGGPDCRPDFGGLR